MTIKLSFELSDRDLRYFRNALQHSREAVRDADESEIIDAVRQVLDEIRENEPLPDFVATRIPELESLIQMLNDDEWQLPDADRERLLAVAHHQQVGAPQVAVVAVLEAEEERLQLVLHEQQLP